MKALGVDHDTSLSREGLFTIISPLKIYYLYSGIVALPVGIL